MNYAKDVYGLKGRKEGQKRGRVFKSYSCTLDYVVSC